MTEIEYALKQYKLTDTPEVRRCLEMAARWLGGFHHLPKKGRQCGVGVELIFQIESFATFDGNSLTRLVFLAHDYAVRVDISTPNTGRGLSVMLHARSRTGKLSQRHPKLVEALSEYREFHGEIYVGRS